MATRLERPRFFEGQYIGAADLEAVIAYARDLGREHALGAHSWGVATGLDLVESAAEGGGVDYFVLPGFGWDGYGRPLVLLEPKQVSAAKFAGLPSGDQMVWLRYSEAPFQGLRPGFETCSSEDGYSRIRESVEVEVGSFGLSQREGGIEIAGIATADARLAPRLFQDAAPDSKDNSAPVLCDGDVPHQEFPADSERWLVPIGVATWQNGAPGQLKARSDDSLKLSRTQRRMAGAVAESLFAADGVIRLRDRFAQFQEGVSLDDLCSPLTADDLENAIDATDSNKTTPRLIGKELVWIEGNLRVTGQARLFGTRLELRDSAGEEADDAPLYARRAVSPNNNLAGQDFQIVIGEQSDGKHRFAVGSAAAEYGDLDERFVVKSNGVFAVGNPIPADLKTDSGLVAATEGVTFALAANAAKTSKVAFQLLPALTELAHFGYDDDTKRLRAGLGTDLARFTYWTADGAVGIRTDAPADVHGDADDLVVKLDGDVGLTLLGQEQSRGSIHFADHPDAGTLPGGFIRYEHNGERLKFGTNHEVQVTIDSQGDVGIGTDTPEARIDVRDNASGQSLRINANSIRALDGGAATRLDLQSGGGGAIFHSGMAQSAQVTITGGGYLGVGTSNPWSALHIVQAAPALRIEATGGGEARVDLVSGTDASLAHNAGTGTTTLRNMGTTTMTWFQNKVGVNLGAGVFPTSNLHVRGNISGDADFESSHVALIENLGGGGEADVLALRVGGAAGGGNNFITFFDNTGTIGRIEQSSVLAGSNPASGGTFLRLLSGGADFAECLPRRDAAAPIGAGRIVGVRGGMVSLDTEGADALMITTDRAVVVGNAMNGAETSEMVAFVGQVFVEVDGPVASGDFILPSGREDGTGRAVPSGRLSPADAGRVVGRAWGDSPGAEPGRVCVAVGVQGADALSALAAALANQQRTIDGLSEALAGALPADGG